MKTNVVFFGYHHQMRRWAYANGLEPRDVIMASSPEALRGRTGDVRAVYMPGWWVTCSPARRGSYDLAHKHIDIILLTGGTMTEETA